MLLKRLNIFFLSLLIIFGFVRVSFAALEIPAGLPNVIDAGQFQKNLQQQTVQRAPKALPALHNKVPPSTPIQGADKIKFLLKKVTITGNTVFSEQELQTIFAPSINKTTSLSDFENLVQEVTVKYRNAGYVLSRAILPAQQIKNGEVQVEVIEGFISRVTVSGKPWRSKSILQAYGNRVLYSKPLNIEALQHEMLLANDLPGMTATAVITPSKSVTNGADLEIVGNQRYGSAYLTYDNYGTRYIGPLETTFSGSLYSLLFPGDSTTIRASVTSKESELQYYDISHTEVIGCNGMTATIGTNYTQTQPLFLLSDLNVIGRSNSVYGNLIYPIIRSRTKNLQIHAAPNYQNVTSEILETPLYQDRIRSLTLGGYLDATDDWGGYSTLGVDVVQGFEIWGADEHFLQSRPRGRSKYTRFTGQGSRLQNIHGRFSAYISASGQYSFNPLLATEQFSYGGPIYGRGYGPSEIVGDKGLATKVELRADTFPEYKFLQAVEYYIFYDAGWIWNLDTFDLPAKQTATSAGFGARVTLIPQISAEVYFAKPLTRQDFTLTPPDQNPQQARVFFQLVARI